MKSNKEKEEKFKITHIFTNKRYYAIANLIFYSVLLIVLIGIVRTSPTTNTYNDNNNNNSNSEEISEISTLDGINKRNFNFIYDLIVDNNKISYVGKMYDKKIMYEDKSSNNKYFIQDDLLLKKIENNYVVVERPKMYFNYFDVDLLNMIFDKSVQDKNDYVISLSDFVKIVKEEDFVSNGEVLIEVDMENNIVRKITFDLTDFVKETEQTNVENALLELKYYDYGLVKDFNINKN